MIEETEQQQQEPKRDTHRACCPVCENVVFVEYGQFTAHGKVGYGVCRGSGQPEMRV